MNEIKLLNENDELYKEKYESIFFKDGKIPDGFDIDKIKENVNKLVA